MVRVIANLRNQKGELAESLGMNLGKGLSSGLNTYFANRSLDSVLQDKALESAPESKKLEAIRSALAPYGEKGQEILKQRLMIQQQEMQEAEQDVIGRVIKDEEVSAKDLSRISPEMQLKVGEYQKRRKVGKGIYDSLIKAGYPEETAELWQNQMESAPVGGQSDVIKHVNGLLDRSRSGQGRPGETVTESDNELNDILASQDEGLTASEKFKLGTQRFKVGEPVRQEAAAKLRGFTRDRERFGILESLENSGKLPKNFDLINVDKEGNLRLPFAGSPEAQRFVKTLNEFSASAKDTYGSRVTNFDLSQYMKRFPTLLNSAEGRRQIIEQMKIVNEINSQYYKNLQDVFSQAGGARKIDSDIAEEFAARRSEAAIDELTKKFDEIGQIETLPSASEAKGLKYRNPDTGEIVISDGKNWNPVQ